MKNIIVAGAMASGVFVGDAHAAELTGGYLDLGYSGFTDNDAGSKYFGAVSGELAFTRSFSTQLDFSLNRFTEIEETGGNATLHAIYHTNNNLSLGAFFGRDRLDSADANLYGLEAGYETGALGLEGYVSRYDELDASVDDSTIFGVKAAYDVNDQFGLSAAVDRYDGPIDIDFTRVSVGADYDVGQNAHIYGEIGSGRASLGSLSNTEAYLAAGVRINFGSERGTTFGRRGLLNIIPGS